MNQNIQNKIPNQTPDTMTDYLQNQRPSVVLGNNNEQIIIPPLNTDIRFGAYHNSYGGGSSDIRPLRPAENGNRRNDRKK